MVLKEERINQRYTRRQLAELVGCSASTIVAIEQRKKNPSLTLAYKLSEVLEKPIDRLFFLPKTKQIVIDKK